MSGSRSIKNSELIQRKTQGSSEFYGETQSRNIDQQHQKQQQNQQYQLEKDQQFQQQRQQLQFNVTEMLSELLILVRRIDCEVKEIKEVLHIKEGLSTGITSTAMNQGSQQLLAAAENGRTSKKMMSENYQRGMQQSSHQINQRDEEISSVMKKTQGKKILPSEENISSKYHRRLKTEADDYENNRNYHYLDISPIHCTSVFSSNSEDPIISMDFFKRDSHHAFPSAQFVALQEFDHFNYPENSDKIDRTVEHPKNILARQKNNNNEQRQSIQNYQQEEQHQCLKQFTEELKKKRSQSGENIQAKQQFQQQQQSEYTSNRIIDQQEKRYLSEDKSIINKNSSDDRRQQQSQSNTKQKSNQKTLSNHKKNEFSYDQQNNAETLTNQQLYQATNRINTMSSQKSTHKRTATTGEDITVNQNSKVVGRDQQLQQQKQSQQLSYDKFNVMNCNSNTNNIGFDQQQLIENKENIESGRLVSLNQLNNYHLQHQKRHPDKLNFYSQIHEENQQMRSCKNNQNNAYQGSQLQSPSSQAIIRKQLNSHNINNHLSQPMSTSSSSHFSTIIHSTRFKN